MICQDCRHDGLDDTFIVMDTDGTNERLECPKCGKPLSVAKHYSLYLADEDGFVLAFLLSGAMEKNQKYDVDELTRRGLRVMEQVIRNGFFYPVLHNGNEFQNQTQKMERSTTFKYASINVQSCDKTDL